MNSRYERYKSHKQKIADVNFSEGILQWDMEVNMPPKGGDFRSQQISTLAGIAHEFSTDDTFGKILEELAGDKSLSEKERRNVLESLKDFKRNKKYPKEFVDTLSRSISESVQVWTKAHTDSDFNSFAPHLEKLVELKRQECEMLGYRNHPYDAMLDLYEPGTKTEDIEKLFIGVKAWLVGFVKEIASKPQNNDSFMYKHYDKNKQWDFGIQLLKRMGFDFEAGRQDIPITHSPSPLMQWMCVLPPA